MKKISIAITAIFIGGSCANFEEDINVDPNNPSQVSAQQLISSAALALQDVSHTPSGEFLAQYLAEVEYQDASLYPVGSSSFYGWYQGPLKDLQTVFDNNMGSANQQAVAKILKAYFFWFITDRWGDVPYSEAMRGTVDLTPAYDSQEFIYTSLFALLKEAEGQIDEGVKIPDDIIYGGNMTKWKKLSASIRLLMSIRLSEVNEQLASTEFTNAINSGIMTSNGDSFIFHHLPEANHQSYWFSQIDPELGLGREWWALSETLVSKMEPVNDPRLAVYGRPAGNGIYTGLVFGTEGALDASGYSLLGDALWEQDAPVYLVTYSELLFAMSEAVKRTWIGGGDSQAEAYYEDAIEQSLLQWTGSADDLATFLSEPGIAYDPATAYEQIATQKYVHLFMNGYQAWAEYRRTGFPDDMVQPLGRAVPTRQMYIETEQFNNSENYLDALRSQFGQEQESPYFRVWWDQ